MRCLVTGASGLLGHKIASVLAESHRVYKWALTRPDQGCLRVDIRDPRAVEQFFSGTPVDVCVHCAANPNIASCERDPVAAYALNSGGTGNVAAACARFDVKLVYVSTDYVFSGDTPGGYSEQDDPCPLQVYGRSKAEGEGFVLSLKKSIVIRVPILYGYNGPGTRSTWPIETATRLLAGEQVLADQREIRQPTLTDDVAVVIRELLTTEFVGMLHVAGPTPTTKFDWGCIVADLIHKPRFLVQPDPSPHSGPARPIKSWLHTDKLHHALGIPMTDLVTGTARILKETGICES